MTNKKNTILVATENNPQLRTFLLQNLAQNPRTPIASVRDWCKMTTQDWLCYISCIEYETISNRDEEDRTELSNYGRGWGQSDEARILTIPLFKDIKDDFPEAKIEYNTYLILRLDDRGLTTHLEALQFMKQRAGQ